MPEDHYAERPHTVDAIHYPDISDIGLTPGDPPAVREDGTPARDGDWGIYVPHLDRRIFLDDATFHARYYEVD